MIAIIGGGPAGIGMGVLLKKMGVNDFIILEKDEVGSSLLNWPKETRLITPSFTGHGFGQLDLNALFPDSSPAYTLGSEHMTGRMYGRYLKKAAEYFELPVREHCKVKQIEKEAEKYVIHLSNNEELSAASIIMACGEFSFPNNPFNYGIHYGEVSSWEEIKGDRVIIGGGESAADAAVQMAENGRSVIVCHPKKTWLSMEVDPSRTISPYTRDRLAKIKKGAVTEVAESDCIAIDKDERTGQYLLFFKNGESYTVENEPIICTGFHCGASQFPALFEWTEDGLPIVNDFDESTTSPSVYLTGPSLRHQSTIFCYIYKFRQRFAIIAQHLLNVHDIHFNEHVLKEYQDAGMFLDDLSCCEKGCEC